MQETTHARRFYVSGMVQGVGFRFFAQRSAQRLGITGYVRNLPDGRVEVYAVGQEPQLDSMRAELKRGPRLASISEVAEEEAPVLESYLDRFEIESGGW